MRPNGRVVAMLRSLDANGYGSKPALFARLHALYPHLPGRAEETLARFFAQMLDLLALDAEAEGLLDALSTAGIPFGVVTNGSQRQWRKLDRLGVRERTDCVFVSETFGGWKPEPAIFRAAADCLGVPPEAVLFVGDHAVNDICGARGVGMKTAWLHRDRPWPSEAGPPCADYALASLGELATLLGLDASPTRTASS